MPETHACPWERRCRELVSLCGPLVGVLDYVLLRRTEGTLEAARGERDRIVRELSEKLEQWGKP